MFHGSPFEVERNPPRTAHFHGTMWHYIPEICDNNWVLKRRDLLNDDDPKKERFIVPMLKSAM